MDKTEKKYIIIYNKPYQLKHHIAVKIIKGITAVKARRKSKIKLKDITTTKRIWF